MTMEVYRVRVKRQLIVISYYDVEAKTHEHAEEYVRIHQKNMESEDEEIISDSLLEIEGSDIVL